MDTQSATRVVIADDHQMVREGLRLMLARALDVDVVGEAANGREAVELVAATKPHVVLMDAHMPVMGGLEATLEIRSRFPGVQVVIVSVETDGHHVRELLEAGAIGYLLKDSSPETIVRAVRDAHEGRGTVDGAVTLAALADATGHVGGDLTPRERDVLSLLASGLSNGEIASQLMLSPSTVRFYVSNVLTKLAAPNRTTAAIIAVKHGLT